MLANQFRLTMWTIRLWAVAVWVAAWGGAVALADPNQPEVDYLGQVKPLLAERCFACHGALKQEANLRLDTASAMLQGGDSGPVVDLDEAAELNLLVERVSSDDLLWRMPPEHEAEPLTDDQVALLRRWIAAGADAPEDETPEPDPSEHWAFQPLQRPQVPPVTGQWGRNPIDAFVARGHDQHALVPQAEASPVELLRRLWIDLVGVPPPAEAVEAFLADNSPGAYRRSAESLLDDPRHGQRWARHWMDIWRYSDWWGLGDQMRNSHKHIWHWRDWIVESLNDDLPYDEMLRLMLAADELAPDELDSLRASGYLARNFVLFNRHQWMDETVEHLGKAMLGLTTNCAKCHDHKYDPISQQDYYRLRAFFEPYLVRTEMVPGQSDLQLDGIPRAFDALLDEPTWLLVRGDENNPDESSPIAPGIPELLQIEPLQIEPIALPRTAWQPGLRPWVAETLLAAAWQQVDTARGRLTPAREQLAAARRHAEQVAADAEATADDQRSPTTAKATETSAAPSEIVETFDQPVSPDWRPFGGQWEHQPGRLVQQQDGPQRAALRLVGDAPRDFEVTLRLTILGGSRWRSVGIGFDCTMDDPTAEAEADDTSQQVYISAHDGGPKVQGAWQRAGQWHYPAEARHARSIETGRQHTLRVRVRDTLVNASLDGEPAIAWRTPLPRYQGSLQITTFDALAALHDVTIKPLAPEVELRDAGHPQLDPDTPRGAQAAVAKAEAELEIVELELAAGEAEVVSIQRRAEAMRQNADRATEAATAQRQAALAKARLRLAEAEAKLLEVADDKRQAAVKEVESARQAVDQAKADAEQPGDQFTPLVGARWTPTRFQHSGRDDPSIEFPTQSSGRRSALADWITDPRNPLTARVAVNHIWNRHFGWPLVPSVFDFGRNGTPPTHPELLDWLASELIDSGWSMKHLHRLIVQSATYRLSSSTADAEENRARDPDNRYLWRRQPIRLESQVVRDSLLALAGTLDVAHGGPPVAPADQTDSYRRSLYFFHSNNERNLFLTMFDEALVTECYQRETSIVPQQALALSNSQLVLDAAATIAQRLGERLQASGDDAARDEAFVRAAYTVLLAAEPSRAELQACLSSLDTWKTLPEADQDGSATDRARANLVWVLLNHNDFVTLR